jgi:hypothetical protein
VIRDACDQVQQRAAFGAVSKDRLAVDPNAGNGFIAKWATALPIDNPAIIVGIVRAETLCFQAFRADVADIGGGGL